MELLLLYVQLHNAVQFQGISVIGRQIGINVWDATEKSCPLMCLSTNFSIVFNRKDSGLVG